MNKEQDEKTCCVTRYGFMAWTIYICNIIASLAVCVVSFGRLGFTLYVHWVRDAREPAIVDALLTLYIGKTGAKFSWASLVKGLSTRENESWRMFLGCMFTTGTCAFVSAIYSVVLLAKPRLYNSYYLPAYFYALKAIYDVLVYGIVSEESRSPGLGGVKVAVLFCFLSRAFSFAQGILCILHFSVLNAISDRNSGHSSSWSPGNVPIDGDQEGRRCCPKCAGFMAWIIHLSNSFVSLAVCALAFFYFGVVLYVCIFPDAGESVLMRKSLRLIYNVSDPKDRLTSWKAVVNDWRASPHGFLYVFLLSMLTTVVCSLFSVIYSVVLLASPHLQNSYRHIPTWVYSGKFVLDFALNYKGQTGNDAKYAGTAVIQLTNALSGLFTVIQLFVSICTSMALSNRNDSEPSCWLPWNATRDGDAQCC